MVGLGGLWAAMDTRVQRGDWKIATNAPAVAPVPLAGPVFSLQRQPATLAYDTTDRQMQAATKPVTDSVDESSCFAASLDGRVVIADGADTPILPASNQKVITAVVALDVLGPDFTFVTRATAMVVGDTVEGDLFLVGGGDPLLSSQGYEWDPKWPTIEGQGTALELLADQVAARVRRVTGRVVGDESHFDTERYAPGWTEEVRGSESGPLSGLFINDARRLEAPDASVDDVALTAADELTQLLRNRGVEVSGGAAVGRQTGPLEEIGRVASLPLAQVIAEMLTNSDNNTAEAVLKEIGAARAPDGVGTRLGGVQVVTDTLAAWDIAMPPGVAIIDGSGLDRSNRLTCRMLVSVLDRAGVAGPLFAGLPVNGSGVGTLDDERNLPAFAGLGIDGRIHAKTGSLRDAKALSGFFDLVDRRSVSFSLLINGENATGRALQLWSAMAQSMAGLSGAVSPAAIALPGA